MGRDKHPHKAPQHPQKGSVDEMSGIHEEHDSLSLFGLCQSRLKLCLPEIFLLFLLVRICGPARDCAYLASLHSNALEKGSDLSGRAFDSGDLFDGVLCLCGCARQMLLKVCFKAVLVIEKSAGLPFVA